jgi:hypothetical protein
MRYGSNSACDESYVEGFLRGLASAGEVEEYERVSLYGATAEQFEAEATRLGYYRGASAAAVTESQYVTRPLHYFGDDDYPFADRRMLHNAFVEGEELIVPKGTAFTSYLPKQPSGIKGRTVKTTVYHAYEGHIDGSVGKRYVRPAVVTMVGTGGYFQEIIVTPDLLRANGLPVYEAPVKGIVDMRPNDY